MSGLLVDTSAWSRAYRRDTDPDDPHVAHLRSQLGRRNVYTTGLVYLELLRGFTTTGGGDTIERDFAVTPFIEPTRHDYSAAADLSVTCRRAGVQLDTVDALLAQLCVVHDLTLLTADHDFAHAARHIPLHVWTPR